MRTVVRYSEAFKMEVMRGLETGRRESIGAARRAYGIRGSITANPAGTVVRGNAAYNLASNSVFIVNTNCTILNLTIRHGKATYGSGISCSALATNIVVSNCIVTRNVYSGTGSGGDIYSSNSISSSKYMTNCTVACNNSAANGGGAYCYAITALGTVRIVSSTIYSNKATNAMHGGGYALT